MNKLLASALTAGLVANVALATPPTMTDMKFDSETKSAVFSVDVSSMETGAITGGNGWTLPTSGTATVVEESSDKKRIDIDIDSGSNLAYASGTAAVADDKATRIYCRFCDCSGTPTTTVPELAQAALTISKSGDTCTWQGLGKATSAGTTAWFTLTGDVTPAINTWYDLRVEFDNANHVRYSVKATGATDYTVLAPADVSSGVLISARTTQKTISSIGFSGYGKIGDFSEDSITGNNVAQIGSATYKSVYDAVTVAGALSGQTVTMLTGVTNSAALKFSTALANALTIDLNGQVLNTSAENLSATIQSGYLVLSSGTVTLGNGCKVPSNGSPYGSCTIPNGYSLSAMAVADTYDGTSYGYVVLSSALEPSDDKPIYTAKDSSGKSVGNIVVEKSWITDKYPTATDAASQQAKLNETGSNGCKVWESYALNLEPDTATSKPIVKASALTGGTSTALFGLDNIGETLPAGYTVTFKVTAKDRDGKEKASASGNAGDTVSMDLPPSSGDDNLRTYTTVVTVKPAQ